MTQYVYRFGGGVSDGGRGTRPARRQGREPRRDGRRSACRCRRASPSRPRCARAIMREGDELPGQPARRSRQRHSPISKRVTGKTFGDAADPLLVSVRSGARVSMPGMMDTVLNLGLNDATVEGLAAVSGDARFAWDSYRRFIQMYSDVVLGLDHGAVRGSAGDRQGRQGRPSRHRARGRRLAARWSRATRRSGRGALGQALPAGRARAALGRDRRGVRLVAVGPRQGLSPAQRHPRRLGHRGQRPGDGVRQYGRDLGDRRRLHPRSLDRRARLLRRISDQRAGRGRRRRHPHAAISDPRARARRRARRRRRWKRRCPRCSPSSPRVFDLLERHYRDMQDIEFTVERGKLWMLQTRSGKRTAKAALQDRGRHGERGADQRGRGGRCASIPPALDQLLHPTLDPEARARRASPRACPPRPAPPRARSVFDADTAEKRAARGREGDPRPRRDQPRGHPRHARRARASSPRAAA